MSQRLPMTPTMDPVTDASAWTGEDLEGDRSWEFDLSPRQQDELHRALQQTNDQKLQLAEITRDNFPLPSLGATLATMLNELRDGKGFAVLHGFPTVGYAHDDIERMYWGLCSHLGTGVTQNSDAGLIHAVTDGARRPRQGTRGVGDLGPVGLHVDLGDCVSLLCVRQAPDDPHSVVSSSITLYDEILRQHPEWLPRLYEGFVWSRQGEEGPGESPCSDYPVPAFSVADGKVTCRFNSMLDQNIEIRFSCLRQ